MAIAIALGAVVLVYGANGYGINTKTGDIIQNGLLFVGSQPRGADIYVNDKLQGSKTSARLILPAASYSLTLKKAGYRNWQRTITLTEHTVSRYTYPLLFPVKPQLKTLKTYLSNLAFISQSPDQHWLLVQMPASSGNVTFDEYDTANPAQSPKTLVVPPGILTRPNTSGSQLKEVEWSADSKNLLLEHTYRGGREFIIFNRETPAASININKVFNASPSKASFRDRKTAQLYLLDKRTGSLQVADTARLTLAPLLKGVLDFTSSGSSLVTYVTAIKGTAKKVAANIWNGSKSYRLSTFAAGSGYLIAMSQYQGHWYYIAGSSSDERLNLYLNPLDGLKDPRGDSSPLVSFHKKAVTKVSFSGNSRFVAAQAGQAMTVYDLEDQTVYRYSLRSPISQPLHWLDGYRLIGYSKGRALVFDYDAANQQMLAQTTNLSGGFFARDYKTFFTTTDTADKATALVSADMRAGTDLPR